LLRCDIMTVPTDHHTPQGSTLGRSVAYRDQYDPSLLYPIPRRDKRLEIGLADGAALPFHGGDLWNGYELSWLDARGKPAVAVATLWVPAESPCLIESKSLKLYLNSFNQTVFAGAEAVADTLRRDLSAAAGAPVQVTVMLVAEVGERVLRNFTGTLLDRLDIDIGHYAGPAPELLCLEPSADSSVVVSEVLVSHLLKSNCLVTGQPDWASVRIAYTGPAIDQAGLLRYLVSFRQHNEFHEQCVERIFCDLQRQCAPQRLEVYARYTRRGGLDINPWRCSEAGTPPPNDGDIRQ
jgi:7-cyano-7-deazaguanine reductase